MDSISQILAEGKVIFARRRLRERLRDFAGVLLDGSTAAVASLTRVELLCLAVLLGESYRSGECCWIDASTRQVAEVAGVSRTAAADAMQRLRQAGYLQMARVRRGDPMPWIREGQPVGRGSSRQRTMYRPVWRPVGDIGRWCEQTAGWCPSVFQVGRISDTIIAVTKWDGDTDRRGPVKDTKISPPQTPPHARSAVEDGSPEDGLASTTEACGRGSEGLERPGPDVVAPAAPAGEASESKRSKIRAKLAIWAEAVGTTAESWMEARFGKQLLGVDEGQWRAACRTAAQNPQNRQSVSWILGHLDAMASVPHRCPSATPAACSPGPRPTTEDRRAQRPVAARESANLPTQAERDEITRQTSPWLFEYLQKLGLTAST